MRGVACVASPGSSRLAHQSAPFEFAEASTVLTRHRQLIITPLDWSSRRAGTRVVDKGVGLLIFYVCIAIVLSIALVLPIALVLSVAIAIVTWIGQILSIVLSIAFVLSLALFFPFALGIGLGQILSFILSIACCSL